jgi:hypothetical protein
VGVGVAERLFGVETEYGLRAAGAPHEPAEVVRALVAAAHRELPHLVDSSGRGIFLQNGARFYVDCGHPEFATPECANPWDLVRHVLAGDHILTRLARLIGDSGDTLWRPSLSKRNVDYVSRATWGCHESYLYRGGPPDQLAGDLVPHLVSRVIYTGAGGFDAMSPAHPFTLSPRVSYLTEIVSHDSTRDRGILHSKQEALNAKGYKRLHLICGESLCSETAMWLKTATTALVLALIEAGGHPGRAVALENPVQAMAAIAADPSCRAAIRLADGTDTTAIRIQRHYLALAQEHAQRRFMPPWSAHACRRWRAMLDRLDRAPRSVETTLDWAIKRALFERHLQRRGLRWESLRPWGEVLGWLGFALQGTERAGDGLTASSLERLKPLDRFAAGIQPVLRYHGLEWAELERYLQARQELLEIDVRFGELSDDGVFVLLDLAGALDHHIDGVDHIADAIAQPPAVGRARLRGQAIRRLAGAADRDRHSASWEAVYDGSSDRVLDLGDPFETGERWTARQTIGPAPDADAFDVPAFLRRR